MANTLYATFPTGSDAERAAGALLDHGVSSADISFIMPERMHSGPSQFSGANIPTGSDSNTPYNAPASTYDPIPMPDPNVPEPPSTPNMPAGLVGTGAHGEQSMNVRPAPGYTLDAQGLPAPDPSRAALTDVPRTVTYHRVDGVAVIASPTVPAVGMTRTTMAANTPSDVVQTDHDHIIDVNRNAPDAARGISTTTSRDAAKGAAEGAGIGLGLGIALGLATVLIPGVGLVAGAGALVAGLAGATAAAGAVAGGAFGFLNDMGLPPQTVHRLKSTLEQGGPILSIHLNGDVEQGKVAMLLEKYGANSVEVF